MQGSRRNPLDLSHPGQVFIATTLVALAIDQIAKLVVRANMIGHPSVPLIPGALRLTYVQNTGAAFGLFPGRQPVFMVTSLLVLFVIAAYWRRAHPTQWPVVIALGLVTAGAAGNLIDRAIFGRVVDFFEFSFFDFPVFNVADICIFLGVVILMAWILFGPQEHPIAQERVGEDSVADPNDTPANAAGAGAPLPPPSEAESVRGVGEPPAKDAPAAPDEWSVPPPSIPSETESDQVGRP